MKTTTKIEIGFLLLACILGVMLQLSSKSEEKENRIEIEGATGEIVYADYDMKDFDAIHSSVNIPIEFSYGDYGVQWEHDSAFPEYIEIEVKCRNLEIRYTDDNYHISLNEPYTNVIHVSSPMLNAIDLSYSASISSKDTLDGHFGDIVMTQNGSADFVVKTDTLKAEMSHNSTLDIIGEADILEIDASHNVDFNGIQLKIRKVDVTALHNSNIETQATESISGKISHNTDLKVAGSPAQVIIEKAYNSTLEWVEE